MKSVLKSLSVLAAFAAIGASAHAFDMSKDVAVSGGIHAQSQNNFRGADFSTGDVSVGGGIKLAHKSGVFGSVNSDTIKIATPNGGIAPNDGHQLMTTFTGGFAQSITPDLSVSAGLKYNQFSGKGEVSKYSFSEMFVSAQYLGAHATLSSNISGSDVAVAGLNKGDIYGELGYTHKIGQFDVGGDLGYTWYGSDSVGAKNGTTVTTLRGGYQVNDNFHVAVSYQLNNGKDGYEKSSANKKTTVKVSYAF